MISHVSVCLLAHEEKWLDFKHFLIHKTGVQLFGSSDWLYSRFFFCYHQITLTRFCCLNRGTNCTSVEKEFP